MNIEQIQALQMKVDAAKSRMDEAWNYYQSNSMFAGSNIMSWALAEDAYNVAVRELQDAWSEK